MRGIDYQVKDRVVINVIPGRASICHFGLYSEGAVGTIPVNYSYTDRCMYIDPAKEGR